MAFEPLQTDEKLDQPAPKKRDVDTVMLFGCGAFLVASLLSYAAAVLPFLILPDIWSLSTLGRNSLIGMSASLAVTVVAARRGGIPGACGSVAGALTTAVFLFLRLQQTFLAGSANQAPTPDYPAPFQLLLPLAWILITALVGVLSTNEARNSTE